MAKIKLTKGELKRERDALCQYERYLPTLQLKKQQLQIEILAQVHALRDKRKLESQKINDITVWAGLLSDPETDVRKYLKPKAIHKTVRNIAGADIPLFKDVAFEEAIYDLFMAPLWVDAAIKELRKFLSILEEISVIEEGIRILRSELRITTQRVNLFEKVKIPEAREAIRRIKIYLGDQMTNAVGRSKIAKRKIELAFTGEIPR